MGGTFVAIDFETADDGRDSACAVGLARVEGARVVHREAHLIRPPRDVMKFTFVHGLTWEMVKDAPPFQDVWQRVAPVLDGAAFLAAHNAPFDRSVLAACCTAAGLPVPGTPWVCTCELARVRWPKPAKNTLPDVCGRLGVVLGKHHEAGADAEACARVLVALEGRVDAPPSEPVSPADAPTLAQQVEIARLVGLGVPPGLAADAAFGRIAVADVERWCREYAAALAAEREKYRVAVNTTEG